MIKKTLKNLIIFGAFAFLFISTNNAMAYYYNNTWYPDYRYQVSTNDQPNAPTMNYANAVSVTSNNPYYNTNNNPSYNNPYYYNNTNSGNTNTYTPTPVVNNYYSTTPTPTPTQTVASNTNSASTPATTTPKNNTASVKSTDTTADGSLKPLTDIAAGNNLTALSLNGSGGFMPSSVWQWLLVIFLILIIIIIARVMSKKPVANNPHAIPAH